ncbi:MAG: dTDP-4-dehydrorhamnose reductase [Ginsengibacter sp.]
MILDNKNMIILVTGANGQLASEIRNISSNFPRYHLIFTTKEELPIEDVNAVNAFFEKNQIHYCVNCAAYTAVDKAETDTENAYKVNADAVGILASVCNAHQTKFIHISTDYVYDGSTEKALKEDDAVAPLNVYGWSKLKGEELALNKNPSSIIIRTSWVYSAFGNNFVKTMLRLFREKEEINVVADQYGSPTYAADLAEVIIHLIDEIEGGKNFAGIFNYSNEGVINWYEFSLAIKEITNSKCRINPIPSSSYKMPAMRPQYSVLDKSKIKTTANIAIPFWKDSLQKCIARLEK